MGGAARPAPPRPEIYDRTLIVLTSDHGEQLGERGGPPRPRARIYNLHGNTLYDELLHVPLVVKLPYQDHAGTRVGRLTTAIDVMPTVLDVLGLPSPGQMQGHLHAGPLGGRAEPSAGRERVALDPEREEGPTPTATKYIVSRPRRRWALPTGFIPARPSARGLYDLLSDPAEDQPARKPRRTGGRPRGSLDQALRRALALAGRTDRTTLPAASGIWSRSPSSEMG